MGNVFYITFIISELKQEFLYHHVFILSLKNFMNFKTFREPGDYDVWIYKMFYFITNSYSLC